MNRGYVKLWRKTLDNGIMRNHQLLAFWVWCLMRATHKPVKVMVGYQVIGLEPGQLIFGRDKAASMLNLSPRTVRTCLETLKNAQQLTIQTTNKYSIISIINWHVYQGNENANDQQDDHLSVQRATNKRPTNDQQTTTNKNVLRTQSTKEEQPPMPPPGGDLPEKSIAKKQQPYTQEFMSFWKAYPRKVGKDAAWRAWAKRNGTRPPVADIIAAVESQKHGEQWQRDGGQYIPNPATWINQGRWADEGTEAATGPLLSELIDAERKRLGLNPDGTPKRLELVK